MTLLGIEGCFVKHLKQTSTSVMDLGNAMILLPFLRIPESESESELTVH